MARVVTHAMKQASLNLRDMVDKKQLGLEVDDILGDATIATTGTVDIRGVRIWDKETDKPEIIQTAIDQVKALFNVKNEVTGWTASYYPPESNSVKGSEVSIPPGEKSLGCRFIIVIGTKEVANMAVSMGSTHAETPMYMLSGDCLNLKITICPVLTISFKNVSGEKISLRPNFRPSVVNKNYTNRHIIVLDGHIEVSSVVEHMAKKLIKKKDDSSDAVSEVAAAASSS
jgi:hypothetical protein